jgi:hypothetical protein
MRIPESPNVLSPPKPSRFTDDDLAIHRSQHEITMSRVLCLCAYCKLIEVNIHLDYKYGMSVLSFEVTSEVFTLCLGVFHEMSGL